MASFAGITLMATAAVLSSVILPEPTPAEHQDKSYGAGDHHRREREETGPHYISYNNSQRTPARSASL